MSDTRKTPQAQSAHEDFAAIDAVGASPVQVVSAEVSEQGVHVADAPQDELLPLYPIGSPLTKEQAAVLEAAGQWWCERAPMNWDDAALAHAVINLYGDWEGCPDCDFECGEPCVPATTAEQHRRVDCHIADLVHEGKLLAGTDYAPPDGWKPFIDRRKLVREQRALLRANGDEPAHPRNAGTAQPSGIDNAPNVTNKSSPLSLPEDGRKEKA